MLVRPVDIWPGDIAGIPGDIHFDHQDNEALRIVWDIFQAFRVNTGVLIGDTFNSSGISRYPRLARDYRWGKATISSERRAAEPWLERFATIVGSNRDPERKGGLHVITGNHERWFDFMADEYPGLLDTPWHELYGDLFDGWHVYADGTSLKFGPLLIDHGHNLRGSLAKNSALSVLANYPGQNSLYGHTHRVESCITPGFKYGIPVDHGAWTIGHLGDPKRELAHRDLRLNAQRHKQGAALVHFFSTGGELRFKVDQITIDRKANGRPYAVMGGVVFD